MSRLQNIYTAVTGDATLYAYYQQGMYESIAFTLNNTVIGSGYKAKGDACLTERGILDVVGSQLGPTSADSFMTELETIAGASSIVSRVVRIMKDVAGGGIDFGDPVVQAQLDAMFPSGDYRPVVDVLETYGKKEYTWAEQILGANQSTSHQEVYAAMRG